MFTTWGACLFYSLHFALAAQKCSGIILFQRCLSFIMSWEASKKPLSILEESQVFTTNSHFSLSSLTINSFTISILRIYCWDVYTVWSILKPLVPASERGMENVLVLALTSISFYRCKVTATVNPGWSVRNCGCKHLVQIWKPPAVPFHWGWCLILLTIWTFTAISVLFYSIPNNADTEDIPLEKPCGSHSETYTEHWTDEQHTFECFIFNFQSFSSTQTVFFNISVTSITEALDHPLYCLPFSSLFHDLFP